MAGLDYSEVTALAAQMASKTRVTAAASAAVREAGEQVEDEAKAIVPTLTGTLRDSITLTMSGGGSNPKATVEATARYAFFVEFGTSVMAPQPYMLPALEAGMSALADALGEIDPL